MHDNMDTIETRDEWTFFTFDLHLLRITSISIIIIPPSLTVSISAIRVRIVR